MTKRTDAVEKYLNDIGEGWCIKYVLIAVVEDADADQSFYIQCLEDQSAAETIGLCEAVSHSPPTCTRHNPPAEMQK
jgi:hypothetical protein